MPSYHSTTPAGTPQALQAGPLSLLLDDGDLRAICLGEREVIRRIAVVVRGANWYTVPAQLSNLVVEAQSASFRVEYDGRCSHEGLEFAYHARIVGDANGSITFGFEGQALTTFIRNRIGLVVLHPVEGCAGQPYRVVRVDGSAEQGVFPDLIAPHQPVRDLGSIAHQAQPDVWVNVQFSGETFEMEDQRNWTDASFKTYSTPLDLPYPVEVTAGTRIAQTISIQLQGDPRNVQPVPSTISVQVGSAKPRPFPRVGLGLATGGQPLTDAAREALSVLRLAHVRADLHLGEPDWETVLQHALDDALGLETRLELAVFVDREAAQAQLRVFGDRLSQAGVPVARCLVFYADGHTTDSALLSQASTLLAGVPLGGGTNSNFTELNRERPPTEGLDYVCYSMNPQVHARDTRSVVENLAGQAETVRSARAFAGAKSLAVTPITFVARPGADPRLTSLFGAAWTLGSLKYLAESGADVLTYYEALGPAGVMPGGGPSVYPLYHVVADVSDARQVIPSRSNRPLDVEVLAVARGEGTRVLLANLSGRPTRVVVSGLGSSASLSVLDEASAERAILDPASYRKEPPRALTVTGSSAEVELGPDAVVRIDTSAG